MLQENVIRLENTLYKELRMALRTQELFNKNKDIYDY